MRLLVLGGTRFLGRHVAQAALAGGHDLTLFNRGLADPSAFPSATNLVGDRDGGLAALAEGEWDAVIDTSGYVPRVVRASAELLASRVGTYVFVSSVSAYADTSRLGMTEDSRTAVLDDPHTEDVEAHYGGLKALCETAVIEATGGQAAILRPGLIVGPHDPTNRFTYWVTRLAAAGEVVAPEPRDQPTQVIDARDLAGWMVDAAERGLTGTFNAVGDVATLEAVLTTTATAVESHAQLRWVAEEKLLADGVEPWSGLPLWLAPGANPDHRGFMAMSNARAKDAGLQLRPLEDTVRDTLAWAQQETAAG